MRRWVPQIVYLDTTYKILPDDGTFYGEIPTLWRFYANKDTQGSKQ
ncbi:MAG: hypothetical protein PUP93_17630 [Rhizonema sp. NSF051]|nr:hypothetical protein [Rhizonema sp. NSF051]